MTGSDRRLKSVKSSFGLCVGDASFGGRQEQPKVLAFSSPRYLCHPLAGFFAETNAGHSAGVLPGDGQVLHVLRLAAFPEVSQPVVRPIPVYMVNLVSWKPTAQVQPNEPMPQVKLVVDPHGPVTAETDVSGCPPNQRPAVSAFVRKKACDGVVSKKLFESGLRKHLAPFIRGFDITGEHRPDGNESSFRPLKLGRYRPILPSTL